MGILDGIKQTVLRCDLLASSATLRVRGEPVYESVLGGILSVAIMSFFIVIFSTSFMEVLNKVDISSSMSSTDQTDSSNQITDLMFAVGIAGVPFGVGNRYFDIYMEQVFITGNSGAAPVTNNTQILLKPCNISAWSAYGDEIQSQFNVFQMDKMLCPVSGSSVTMKGYEGSPDYAYLTLKIKSCTNNSYQTLPCRTNTAINTFITSHLSTNDFFKVRFMILDTRISPGQSDPISRILQKKIFMSFTNTLGTSGFISFAHYTVTTDTSIMPYSNEEQLTGSYILKYQTSTVGLSSGRYVFIEFYKGTQQLSITRSVSKVDQMLSYVGGLFGLLWVAVAFFLGAFNQYRYELYAAEAAFTFDESGRKIKQKDFGFISYVCYSIYDWLNVFGLAPSCWTKMKQIDQVRQQICAQMDITYLLRKIRSLQKTTACLMNHNKRICSMITKQPTLEETAKQRKLLQFYHKLVPSPCQDHVRKHPKGNQVDNLDFNNQSSGQQFTVAGQKFNIQQNLSQIQQQMSCVTVYDEQQDQDYEQLMNMIKDAYSSMQGDKDQLSKRIKQKIPDQIKRAISKSKRTRKITVEQISKKKFESCENSFIDAKYK